MQAITWTSLKTNLQPWLNSRFLTALPYVQGGWEKWIQIDFVAYLNHTLAADVAHLIDIERESNLPYNNGGIADWLVNRNTQDATHAPLVLEIKAQSPMMTGAAFHAGVAADIAQLSSANLVPAYAHAMRIALAFTINTVSHDDLLALGMVEVASFQGHLSVLGINVTH